MNYCSLSDLSRDIWSNCHRIPRNVDLVIGIPRSGLMSASLIALALNLPLADVEGFANGRLIASGTSRRRAALDLQFEDVRHALLVDDSISSGGSMARALAQIRRFSDKKITTCAVYGLEDTAPNVDIVFRIVPLPRAFEWNVMHHDILRSACVDIDGVLCIDPTPEENDDGPAYLDFLRHARPYSLPTKRINTLVTSRLEKYRPETVAWLEKFGIEYDQLVMLNLPDAATRRRLAVHGSFKGAIYRDSAATLFIESEFGQARQIADISRKDVLCFGNQQVVRPGELPEIAQTRALRYRNGARRLAQLILPLKMHARLRRALLYRR